MWPAHCRIGSKKVLKVEDVRMKKEGVKKKKTLKGEG